MSSIAFCRPALRLSTIFRNTYRVTNRFKPSTPQLISNQIIRTKMSQAGKGGEFKADLPKQEQNFPG